MATNIFKLIGEVSVNMSSFNNAMDTALGKVNSLAAALNNLNGTNATVTVNQTGTGVPTVTTGSASSGSTTSGGTQSGTGTSGDASSGGTMVVAPGSDGWTIGKGVVSSWLASAGKWAFDQVVDQLGEGWDRNKNEAIFAERLGMFTGLDDSETWQFVEKINQFAYDTPLDVADTWDVATKLLNFGVLSEDLIDTLWMLGDITLGDNTKMASLAKAYTDTLGKGMLYAEEGRQYVNAGVPIWKLLETYYASDDYNGPYKGYDAMTIKGQLNDGVTVTAEDLTAALRMATSEGGMYYNAMTRMMGTQFGQEQVLDENMTNIAAAFVDPFQKFYTNELLPGLVDLTSMMNEILNPGTEFHQLYNSLVDKGVISFSNVDTPLGTRLFEVLGSSGEQTPDNDRWKYTREWLGGVWDSFLDGDFLFSNWFDKDEDNSGTGNDGEAAEESRPREKWNPMGGPFDVKTITFDDGQHFLPGAAGASTLFTQLSDMPNRITAAVQEGFSGATVTVNVSTGDVRLNEGTLVGTLAPRVDAILGAMGARAARG